jgi:hypothetical protein
MTTKNNSGNLLHTRQISYEIYEVNNNLWDIEGSLKDIKTSMLDIPDHKIYQPGNPYHEMKVRVSVNKLLIVQNIETVMTEYPTPGCIESTAPMKKMIGCCLAAKWRKSVEENLGNEVGCTHLREILFGMPNAAFQGVPGLIKAYDGEDIPPIYLGQCKGWDFSGPAVLKHYPKFYKGK